MRINSFYEENFFLEEDDFGNRWIYSTITKLLKTNYDELFQLLLSIIRTQSSLQMLQNGNPQVH